MKYKHHHTAGSLAASLCAGSLRRFLLGALAFFAMGAAAVATPAEGDGETAGSEKVVFVESAAKAAEVKPANAVAPTPGVQRLAEAKGPWLAVKTNLLYWGVALPVTPNIGAEVKLARHFTLECEVGLNPFKHKNDDGSYGRSFRHLRVHPEVRYWFCEAFYKHFIGLHVPFVDYNFSNIHVFSSGSIIDARDKRLQGWCAGLGLSYGYDWAFAKHWNLEGTIGGGWLRLNHKEYPCAECGTEIAHVKKNYWGLTQAGITLSYLF